MAIDYTSASIARSQARPQLPRRQFFCDEVGRREFVCGGGAGVLSMILATRDAVAGLQNARSGTGASAVAAAVLCGHGNPGRDRFK
jgi:7,8-dihydropterin-6-yl-methyl-4-(beta-D-ribofuranosyl)aminobenzene 5'-phosphate synthase